MTFDKYVKNLKRKRKRYIERLKQYDLDSPEKELTYHGGVSVGILKGKLSTVEDVLDELEPDWEEKEKLLC